MEEKEENTYAAASFVKAAYLFATHIPACQDWLLGTLHTKPNPRRPWKQRSLAWGCCDCVISLYFFLQVHARFLNKGNVEHERGGVGNCRGQALEGQGRHVHGGTLGLVKDGPKHWASHDSAEKVAACVRYHFG